MRQFAGGGALGERVDSEPGGAENFGEGLFAFDHRAKFTRAWLWLDG